MAGSPVIGRVQGISSNEFQKDSRATGGLDFQLMDLLEKAYFRKSPAPHHRGLADSKGPGSFLVSQAGEKLEHDDLGALRVLPFQDLQPLVDEQHPVIRRNGSNIQLRDIYPLPATRALERGFLPRAIDEDVAHR